MSTIVTKSNKSGRTIELEAPAVFGAESLSDLVKFIGEDQVVTTSKAQLMVSYRSMVRTKLEAQDDNGDFVNPDDAIKALDFSDWKPEQRVRKTAEEKALEALGALPPEVRAAVLAKYKKAQK